MTYLRAFLDNSSITPGTLSGDENDFNPPGLANAPFVEVDGGAADRNITGLLAPTSRARRVGLVNVGTTNALVLQNQNASSAAANRFAIGTGIDLTLDPGDVATIWYDQTASRWRVI